MRRGEEIKKAVEFLGVLGVLQRNHGEYTKKVPSNTFIWSLINAEQMPRKTQKRDFEERSRNIKDSPAAIGCRINPLLNPLILSFTIKKPLLLDVAGRYAFRYPSCTGLHIPCNVDYQLTTSHPSRSYGKDQTTDGSSR